jgi:hypothetical protein
MLGSRVSKRRLWLAIVLVAGTSTAAGAQSGDAAPRVCALVTQEEAATLLGPKAERLEGDTTDTCHYVAAGQTMQVVVRMEEMKQGGAKFLEIVRRPAMTEKGYTTQDEPSMGKGSFSARKTDSLDFQLAHAKGVLGVGIRNPGGTVPPELMEKLRAVARKAAGRF